MSMTDRDGVDPDYPLVDPASDEESTGHLGPGDLAPDEERLLAALERDAQTCRPVSAEDTLPPLPSRAGPPDDGLTPRFAAPEFD
jgi:hypothetical protein